MKQFILLASLLSTCYSTDPSLCRLEAITWSLPPNGSYGFVEAEYIVSPEIEGQVHWLMEATQRPAEVSNDPLLDVVDDTNSTWNNDMQERPRSYYMWIFNNQKHEITSSKWQDGDGVHHSSRINFSPVPVELADLGVWFIGSGVRHTILINEFPTDASGKGSIAGNIELLKKPRNYLRMSGGEAKLHTSFRAKAKMGRSIVGKVKDVVGSEEVHESNIEVEDYTRGGFFFRSIDVVLPNSDISLIEGDYISAIFQNAEVLVADTQVLPNNPEKDSLYQNNTMLYVDACNPMSKLRDSQDEGIEYFKFDVGWQNCVHCMVFGYPNPTVQIFRDDIPMNRSLGPNESATTVFFGKDKVERVFLMEPVDESVAGRYKCVGKADGSEEVSQEFIVEVESVA